uniref:Uncharacterized protein n=1 Tax=Anopheles atroparvus TaxID=41427 RepID=A0AAG5DQ48_ANOAO
MELVVAERDAGRVGLGGAARHVHGGVVVAHLLLVRCRRAGGCHRCYPIAAAGKSCAGQRRWCARLTAGRAISDGARFERLYVVLHARFGRLLLAPVERAVAGAVRCRVVGVVVQVGDALALGGSGHAHASDGSAGTEDCRAGGRGLRRSTQDRVVDVLRGGERVLPVVML